MHGTKIKAATIADRTDSRFIPKINRKRPPRFKNMAEILASARDTPNRLKKSYPEADESEYLKAIQRG